MAIFSRRTIQQLIDDSSAFLASSELLRKLRNLDERSDETIPTEWELAVLVAFSRLGSVSPEPDGGSTRPDLQFVPRESRQPVVIEISVVSDKHLHEENPFELLMEDFRKRLSKVFPEERLGRFHLDVRPISPMPVYRGSRVTRKLRLPRPHQFKQTIFNRRFAQFLASVKAAPTRHHQYVVKSEQVDVAIRFDPTTKGLSGGYPVFTLAHSKTSNPVANVLHAKAQQLRASSLPGPYGIVICDGGCDLLSRRQGDDWSSFHLDDVVQHFLQINTSVSFVSVLVVVADNSGRIGPRHLRIQQRLYHNRDYETLDSAIKQSILKLPDALPPPARTAVNARNHLTWLLESRGTDEGDTFEGGFSMSDRNFKVSLRTIQALLGGRTDAKTFDETHGFPKKNPFLRNLEEGRLIVKVEVEKGILAEDDDWLIFTFGTPDPAVSPYRPPVT
ncbi:MAG TPA: hypothetical protein VEV41_16335 [Terriglobales bacterium]|nr:hypothetical protein [Terriglobales bacterium]